MNKFEIKIECKDIDFILNRIVNLIRKRNYHLDEIHAKWWETAIINAKITVNESISKEQVENQIKKIYDINELKIEEIVGK